jgi:hypothetical protein
MGFVEASANVYQVPGERHARAVAVSDVVAAMLDTKSMITKDAKVTTDAK